jgi:Spy/CpxP family protein refolding chaperone
MKTVVSFLLGAVMLFGAATLGLQSATANAKDKHDRDYWRHHRHHHHHHYRRNKLSY